MTERNVLHSYRLALKATQANMADLMGLSLRGYEELEAGRTAIRDLHVNAARYACIKRLIEVGPGVFDLPAEVADDLKLATKALDQS